MMRRILKPITTTRRVVKCGSSFYLCLPKVFVKRHNIQKGERLPVIAGDEVLKVVPLKEK